MNIYVLLKRTFDSEEKIALEDGQISSKDVTYILNPYDEFALEEALRICEEHGGQVTAVTVGSRAAEKELRTALAMGVDQAVLILQEDDGIMSPDVTATLLNTYLQDKQYDLILTGNASIDYSSGQVGVRLAQMLDIPCVSAITKLTIADQVAITRDAEGNTETILTYLPLLATCQQGLNEPRYPSLQGIMKAKKKPFEFVEMNGLEISPQIQTCEIYLPAPKQAVTILQGSNEERVAQLVEKLINLNYF